MNIIAVDDEPAVLSLLSKAIQQALPDTALSCFSSAQEAFSYAKEHPVDVAFLDIEMGETSGINLAKALTKFKPDVNIIFVTGHGQYMDEAFRLYASGYVRKPPRVARIEKELSHLRHNPGTVPKPLERVGAFTFDHTARRVCRNGNDLLLKPMEFRILLFLASNPGKFFPARELYAKTSGLEPAKDACSLYVHMSGLRKKLGLDDAGTEQSIEIEHRRGKGYQLNVW